MVAEYAYKNERRGNLSNGRAMTTARKTELETTPYVKDYLALIKIGIVNSNLVIIFTVMGLAFQFAVGHFLERFNFVNLYNARRKAVNIAGFAVLND